MARQIQLTQDQILKVLEAMHYICVYVGSEEELRITCGVCDHNLFVGFEGEDQNTGTEIYENDLGADELFIRAGEHCLTGPSGLSECEAITAIGIQVDVIANSSGIDLDQNDL